MARVDVFLSVCGNQLDRHKEVLHDYDVSVPDELFKNGHVFGGFLLKFRDLAPITSHEAHAQKH
jgi:hypothetical protein